MKLKKIINRLLDSKFISQLFSYTFFSAIQKLLPFLLLPILSRVLSVTEIGYFVLYQTIILILYPLQTLSIQIGVQISFYKHNQVQFGRYLTNILIFGGVTTIFWMIMFVIIGDYVKEIINLSKTWMIIISVLLYLQFIIQIRLLIYRCQEYTTKYGLTSLLSSLLNNIIGILLLFYSDLSWHSIVLGTLIGNIIISTYSIYSFYKERLIILKKSLTYIKDSIKIGFPISFHMIGGWLMEAYNRIIINSLLGTAATGSFGIGATFAMIMTFIQDSINLAYAPYLYDKLKKSNTDTKKDLIKTSIFLYGSITIAGILISLAGYFLVGLIFGNKYLETKAFIIPLVISAMINGYYKIHVNYLFYFKHTISIAKITFTIGLLNIPLAYLSIKYYGFLGAAYLTLLLNIITYSLITYEANKIYPLDWIKNILFLTKTPKIYLHGK